MNKTVINYYAWPNTEDHWTPDRLNADWLSRALSPSHPHPPHRREDTVSAVDWAALSAPAYVSSASVRADVYSDEMANC